MSISLSAQLRVRSTGLAGIGEPSNLSWISHSLNIFGTGTNNSGGAIAFGDNTSTTKNVVIGEYTGDSDVLLLHGKNGLSLSTGSSISQKIKINSSGYMSLGTTTTYGRITMYCNSSAKGVGIYGTSGTFRLYTIGEDCNEKELITRDPDTRNCYEAGDLCCDTEADPDKQNNVKIDITNCIANFETDDQNIIPSNGDSNWAIPISNIMSYYGTCRNELTDEQYTRMRTAALANANKTSISFTKSTISNLKVTTDQTVNASLNHYTNISVSNNAYLMLNAQMNACGKQLNIEKIEVEKGSELLIK